MDASGFFPVSRSLRDRGFVEFSVPDMSHEIGVIVRGFADLLADEESVVAMSFPENSYVRDEFGEPFEFGILAPKTGGEKGDRAGFFDTVSGRKTEDANKRRFHYLTSLITAVPSHLFERHFDLFAALEALNRSAMEVAIGIARALDEDNPDMPLARRYVGSLARRLEGGVAVTRLIRYGNIAGNAPDAQVHRDRGFLTVHAYASAPGLVIYDGEDRPTRIRGETDPTSVAVFTGEKFWGSTRGKLGFGAPHGVYDARRGEPQGSPREDRITIVTFVHDRLTWGDKKWMRHHAKELYLDQNRFRVA